jgi:hypothetical protein
VKLQVVTERASASKKTCSGISTKNISIKRCALIFGFAFLAISLVTLFIGLPSANADQYGRDYRDFSRKIRSSREQCESLKGYRSADCDLPGFVTRPLYDLDTGESRLSTGFLERLRQIAVKQTHIWPDTILEGDFEAAGDTRIDKVEAIHDGELLVAYRIHYSETAWYTGDCDPEKDPTLRSCRQGRISEASFVSPMLTSWMRDDFAYAKFR